MDVRELHARSVDEWLDKVRAVPADRWSAPTPCSDWDVRALVNHIVGEDRWTTPMVEGQTIEQVGSRFDGDLLGADPVQEAEAAGKEAVAAFTAPDAMERTVHLSFGDHPAELYAWQLTADHLVHGWDLAAAAGIDRSFSPELVGPVAEWFAAQEEGYRSGGAIGARPDVAADSPLDRLLVGFGRDPSWGRS